MVTYDQDKDTGAILSSSFYRYCIYVGDFAFLFASVKCINLGTSCSTSNYKRYSCFMCGF